MKIPLPVHARRCPSRGSGGFALVITVSLMVLLTLLAVALLSLSSVSLRAASEGQAQAVARANAKLALMLAIGDLQRKLGPDQRISAPANLVDSSAPLGVTGAWEAWTAAELASGSTGKNDKFIGWLSSQAIEAREGNSSEPGYLDPDDSDGVLLVGEHTLGERETLKGDDQRVASPKVTVQAGAGAGQGRLAWMTFDESVKSRIDLYDRPLSPQLVDHVARAGGPPRHGVFALENLEDLRPDAEAARKMVSYDTAGFDSDGANGVAHPDLPAYRPDLTVWSKSLLTNPVNGGLKKDLSLWFTNGLGASERRAGLYASHGLPTGPADPPLSLLAGYHELYREIGRSNPLTRINPGAGAMAAQVPTDYRPAQINPRGGYIPRQIPPSSPVLVPSLLRVDVIFSMIARDVHGGRSAGLRASGYPYLLHLMYLPIVTLHNPYDVPLVFDWMKFSFRDVPVGFQFQVNGQDMTTQMIPLNNLYVNFENSRTSKEFGITVRSAATGNRPIRIEPGQTKLFGTPRVPPTWSWAQEQAGSGADGVHLFDWRNDKTSNFNLMPTLITQSTTTACGFDVDWLQPRHLKTPAGNTRSNGEGIIALRPTDQIGVRYGPVAVPTNEFYVNMELGAGNRVLSSGIVRMNYGSAERLEEIVEEGTSLRYPDEREFPAVFPDPTVDGAISTLDIYEPAARPVRNYVNAKPFLLFSMSGKTTLESFVPGRPFADGPTATHIANIDVAPGKEAPGDQPYELVMMPIRSNTPALEEFRDLEEGYFFGGHGALNGTTRATFHEVPRVPLQSLAQFRHANLASSGFHPFTTYTVGESQAHPMMPSDAVTHRNPVDGSTMLDHTWLANTALWDGYFLSTIADYEGEAFGPDGASAEAVAATFLAGDGGLLNPRLGPMTSEEEADEIAGEITGAEGWLAVARYAAIHGGFNVNSTSVDAWVSALSSLRDVELQTGTGDVVETGDYAAFPRVRLPAAESFDGKEMMERMERWQGFRQLEERQIEELAERIVEQIRSRGPFLSLSEFVNRRLGSSSDERSLRGAIAAAIEETDINNVIGHDGLVLNAGNLGPHNYETPQAAHGSNVAGAPGALSQGDVLSVLGSHLAVRGDTFVIRSYGEALDGGGRVTARAWAEAVVQRTPDYVDIADEPDASPEALAPVNERFGRRFEVVSFRWLAPSEI